MNHASTAQSSTHNLSQPCASFVDGEKKFSIMHWTCYTIHELHFKPHTMNLNASRPPVKTKHHIMSAYFESTWVW